jgi:hypothetical protein
MADATPTVSQTRQMYYQQPLITSQEQLTINQTV